jgi:energy-coupling factor transporter ATP-binding protein EcfA2
MLSDVRNYYGLARDFGQAGYFETEHSEQIVSELKLEIKAGKLVALSGIVGCGKTTMLRRIQEALSQDKEILASKSLSLEKSQISLATLIMALFYDLATEKDFKIPTQPERRERALRDLIKKRQKPIALFIDDAHDLHSKTLIGLKRLIEVVRDSGVESFSLSIPTASSVITLSIFVFGATDCASNHLRYFRFSFPKPSNSNIVAREPISSIEDRRRSFFSFGWPANTTESMPPLQFEYYLTHALEEAYKVGQKPVGADMIENVLAKDINGLEPRLTRQGYNAKVLAELLNAKPREIKSFLSGQLASGRTQELQSELLAAGIPL